MINQYYNGLIHTVLVVPVVPVVPYSYDDFAKTVSVLGVPPELGLTYFKESPEDSPERRLYKELSLRNLTTGDGWPVDEPVWATGKLGRKFYRPLSQVQLRYPNKLKILECQSH